MKKIIIILSSSLLLLSCVELSKELQSDWNQKMQGLAGSYNKLLPYMYDDYKYSHNKNKYEVKTHLSNIVEDSKYVSDHVGQKISGQDPFFKLGLKGLRRTTAKALHSFNTGNYSYSQQLIQASINYCYKCHTRTAGGPEFIEWSNFKLPTGLDPISRSRILVATRQFDKAEKELHKFITQSPPPKDDEIISSIKQWLVINLRYRESPDQALATLDRLNKSRYQSNLNKKTQSLLSQWRSSLKKWISNKKHSENLNLSSLLSKKMTPRSNPENHLVNSLRESILLHKSLLTEKGYEKRAKIYYRLGLIYQDLPEVGFWELPEVYFESCILLQPHTSISRKCYASLEKKFNDDSRLNKELILPRREKNYLLKLKSKTLKNPHTISPIKSL